MHVNTPIMKTIFLRIGIMATLFFSHGLLASPNIQHWQTSNGGQVYFVAADEIPMVDVRIVFDAGSARDSQHPAGTALMTNGLLAEGAAGDDAQIITEKFERVGAQFGNGALRDMAWLSLRSLRDDIYLQPALINLKNILSYPDFPEKAFKRELKRLQISVERSKQSPGAIASRRFYRELYGNHPYAQPSEGTEQSLQKLRLRDLKDFYKQYYVAKNAVIAIVGKLTRAEAEKMAEHLLSALPAGQHAPALPSVEPLGKARTVRIDFPSRQTTILMGQLGMARGDPDYYALYLANHAFGGSGFGSRLLKEVREKRGLAYSAYSYFSPMRETGPFQIGLQTRNDQTDQTLEIIHSELNKYIQQGPDQEELEDSLKNITGGFPLRIDSNKKIVEYLSMIGFYNLPLDYLKTFVGKINQQTVQTVNNALKRRIHPQKMLTVIVGGQ